MPGGSCGRKKNKRKSAQSDSVDITRTYMVQCMRAKKRALSAKDNEKRVALCRKRERKIACNCVREAWVMEIAKVLTPHLRPNSSSTVIGGAHSFETDRRAGSSAQSRQNKNAQHSGSTADKHTCWGQLWITERSENNRKSDREHNRDRGTKFDQANKKNKQRITFRELERERGRD